MNFQIDHQTDIAIIGAGPVGLTLAAFLLQQSNWRVTMIDPDLFQNHRQQVLALSRSSFLLLQQLSCWPESSVPIHRIHISQQACFGRMLITSEDDQRQALGYTTTYHALMNALQQKVLPLLAEQGIEDHVVGVTQKDVGVILHLSKNKKIYSCLLVHAEGEQHKQGERISENHEQHAVLVTTVQCTRAKSESAWERWTKTGAIALLPQGENSFALIWSAHHAVLQQKMALCDEDFLKELDQIFGHRLGQFVAITQARKVLTLAVHRRKDLVVAQEVWIGNAAQTLHPIAAQGLNLGLRDAYCLAQALQNSLDATALANFVRARGKDRNRTVMINKILAHPFLTRWQWSRWGLAQLLTILDSSPFLRERFIDQMMLGYRQ